MNDLPPAFAPWDAHVTLNCFCTTCGKNWTLTLELPRTWYEIAAAIGAQHTPPLDITLAPPGDTEFNRLNFPAADRRLILRWPHMPAELEIRVRHIQ
jgi:hypothetical protein